MGREVTVKVPVDVDKVKASYIRNDPTLQRLLAYEEVRGIYFGIERAICMVRKNTTLGGMPLMGKILHNPAFGIEVIEWLKKNIQVI